MKRAWIIGNGPSLINTNLDLIKGERSFASNRIHLIYGRTKWRPTDYVRSENLEGYDIETVANDIKEAFKLGITMWMPTHFRDGFVAPRRLRKFALPSSREEYFTHCEHAEMYYDDPGAPTEWHLPRVCHFGTVTAVAIQIAVKDGCDEIYLVGADLDYKDGRPNHFTPDYEMPGYVTRADRQYYGNLRALENAKRSCPVPIVNCTVGGKLELFPRMTIEEVLSGKRLQPGQGSAPGSQLDGSEGDDRPVGAGSGDVQGQPEVRQGRRVQGKRPGAGE